MPDRRARRRGGALPGRASLVLERVDPAGRDARWCLERYFAELAERFEQGFDVARSLVADHRELVPPAGAFLVGTVDGRPVACGALKRTAPEVAYLKRMWVDPELRGRGIGRRLLAALEEAALELGCTVAQLETNRALAEAIALYEASGYREIEPFNDEHYADHWFEKRLTRAG